jgi:hypothetical protein
LAAWAGEGQVRAVGESGRMFHSPDGARWDPVPGGTTRDLRFVVGHSPDDLGACGSTTAMRHWNGAAWTMVEVPGLTNGARAAHPSTDGDVRVLDDGNRLHRRRGTAWSIWIGAFGQDAFGVDAAGTIHAVGGGGGIMHCTPTGSCTHVSFVPGCSPRAIDGTDGDDVWVAGYGTALLHWDGVRWNAVDLGLATAFDARGIRLAAPDDVWIAGPSPPFVRRRRGPRNSRNRRCPQGRAPPPKHGT